MLIYAVWQVLQHADVCYNLPLGLWIIHKSKVKEKYCGYSWYWLYTSVCVIYGAADKEDVERYQISLVVGIKPPQGFSWSPPSWNTHTHALPLFTLLFHTPLLPTNTVDSADLFESQSASLVLSIIQSICPQLPHLTPHSKHRETKSSAICYI